jgi:histidinol-phosphate aminotransferase
MNIIIADLLRENIRNLIPYSSARDDFKGKASIWLDANENPYETGYNRYPDPYQLKLKERIAEIKYTRVQNIFIGNGSDEVIDLVIRAFCNPGKDKVISIDPSYGMYEVSANINNVELIKFPLRDDFTLDEDNLLKICKEAKIIFLCSPNNPSGNSFKREQLLKIILNFNGLVVIDEAYIDFSAERSLIELIPEYNNLIVMQTLSKAWGLAGLRIGLAFCDAALVSILNKIKPPYNINTLSQQTALKALTDVNSKSQQVNEIISEREILKKNLKQYNAVILIYPSDSNFLLVKFKSAQAVYAFLTQEGIVVRDRSKVLHCSDCLRISVGTPKENKQSLKALKRYEESTLY